MSNASMNVVFYIKSIELIKSSEIKMKQKIIIYLVTNYTEHLLDFRPKHRNLFVNITEDS